MCSAPRAVTALTVEAEAVCAVSRGGCGCPEEAVQSCTEVPVRAAPTAVSGAGDHLHLMALGS